MKKNTKKKGFTLVELLIVIAILAILASVSIVGYLGFTQNDKDAKCITELVQYKTQFLSEISSNNQTDASVVYGFDENGDVIVIKGSELEDNKAGEDCFINLLGLTVNETTHENFVLVFDDGTPNKKLLSVIYSNNGGKAIWDLTNNTITPTK